MFIQKKAVICQILSAIISVLFFCCVNTSFAQSNADQVLELLKQGAENEKSVGSYLWKQTHRNYTNLGDFAAEELNKFLEKGLDQDFELGGKKLHISVSNRAGQSSGIPSEAEFSVELVDKTAGTIEQGVLMLNLDEVKDYVNQTLYPEMKQQLSGPVSESVPLIKDLVNLLPVSVFSPAGDGMASVWSELVTDLDSYPAVQKILEKEADRPLLTLTADSGEGEETETLQSVFGGGSIQSSKELVESFGTINADPIPRVQLDTEPEQSEPSGQINPVPSFSFLSNPLPATGFPADHVTLLPSRPKEISYDVSGYTLQIPKLDVAEMIVTVPLADGNYPIDWLESNIGLLEESSFPGQGISVLTGHNHLSTTEVGPFLLIETLEKGDRLFITDQNNNLISFKVYENCKIPADEFVSIADNLKENTLVMITCEDESVDGGYLNRRVIFAEPI